MADGSIYVPRDEKFTGGSPQVMYESFWVQGREARLKRRGVFAAIGLIGGVLLSIRFSLPSFWTAVTCAGIVAAADTLIAWRSHEATAVWRGERRGEDRTGRLLRRRLGKHGYTVIEGHAIPGKASIDHLVIGPGGVWIVDNEAWPPDTDLARYGSKLFFGEKSGGPVIKELTNVASSLAMLLSRETEMNITIRSMLAVHGGKILPSAEPRGTVTAEGVTLAYPRRVPRWILTHESEEAHLTDEQVELIARTAARIMRRMYL
ncbi:MAG TPA: NERD domain-containing protein [Thermopolyspora sp.]